MSIAVGGCRPPVSKQATRHVQALTVHDRMGGVAVSQVVKPRILYQARLVAHPAPETIERPLAHVPFRCRARKHPFIRARLRQTVQQRPRGFTERDLPWTGLGLVEHEAVALHIAPPQAPHLARAAARQQDQPHRRSLQRALVLHAAQCCPEPRQVVLRFACR